MAISETVAVLPRTYLHHLVEEKDATWRQPPGVVIMTSLEMCTNRKVKMSINKYRKRREGINKGQQIVYLYGYYIYMYVFLKSLRWSSCRGPRSSRRQTAGIRRAERTAALPYSTHQPGGCTAHGAISALRRSQDFTAQLHWVMPQRVWSGPHEKVELRYRQVTMISTIWWEGKTTGGCFLFFLFFLKGGRG